MDLLSLTTKGTLTQNIGRVYEIATILIRYGFGETVRLLGLGKVLTEAGRLLNWQSLDEHMKLSFGQRVRRVLEELGPTYIKLGQILSTRVDLFPPEMIRELEKLQAHTTPIPFEDLREQLEEDLEGPVDEVFLSFDREPFGTASIAQVHYAVLRDGTKVVVKIRKPGIRKVVEADLRLIRQIAVLAEKEVADLRLYRPVEMSDQFAHSLSRELDLAEEGRHADRARRHIPEESKMKIPKVYWEYTSERLNVQERITGIPGFEVERLPSAGCDPVKIAQDGARTISELIVEYGFFHADPYPGNLFYLENNRFALVDWGMVGRLTVQRREQIIDLLMGMVRYETDRVREILIDWSTSEEEEINQERLMIYIEEFLDKYHGVELRKLDISSVFFDLTKLLRENRISLPADLALVFKVFITLEALGRRLNPKFDLVTEARPILERAISRRYRPTEMFRRGRKVLRDSLETLLALPKDFRVVARAIRKGQVRVHVDIEGLDNFGQRIDDAASRVSTSLVTAAFILSTSLVMSIGESPDVYGIPLFDILGYGAMIGGLFVLFSILRANRQRHKRKK